MRASKDRIGPYVRITELANRVRKRSPYPLKVIRSVIKDLELTILDALVEGRSIRFSHLGKLNNLSPLQYARKVRGMYQETRVVTTERRVTFIPFPYLRDVLNERKPYDPNHFTKIRGGVTASKEEAHIVDADALAAKSQEIARLIAEENDGDWDDS